MQVITYLNLPEVFRASGGGCVVQIVFDGSICTAFDQKLRHRQVPRLSGHVERSHTLTMCQPAEGGLLVYVGAVIEQPCGRLGAVACRRPNQRSTSIWIGVEPRPGSHQSLKHAYAIALACPHERFVEYLLRIRRRLPIRESAMRSIEASSCAGLGRQSAFAGKASIHQFVDAKPDRGSKIVWGHSMASQQIGNFAMSPEQRSNQRSTSPAVRFRIESSAFREQQARNPRLVRVCSRMKRSPAAIIRIVHLGTGREQRVDRQKAMLRVRLAGKTDSEV